jgi:hypothetical protein
MSLDFFLGTAYILKSRTILYVPPKSFQKTVPAPLLPHREVGEFNMTKSSTTLMSEIPDPAVKSNEKLTYA